MQRNPPLSFIMLLALIVGFSACKNNGKPVEKDIALTPGELREKTITNIRDELEYAAKNGGGISDSVFLNNVALVKDYYSKQDYKPVWIENDSWRSPTDSLIGFITSARLYGLFPDDYHLVAINKVRRRFASDTSGKGDNRDAALWSRLDITLTDAFFQLIKDIKLGRLPNDSVSLRKDSLLTPEDYTSRLNEFRQNNNISQIMALLEPGHAGYRALRESLADFLKNVSGTVFTKVPPPKPDPVSFRMALQKRLVESGYLQTDTIAADSIQLVRAIRAFQQDMGITVDGQAGSGTLRLLNLSDNDRFISIAITLDRYKLLPESMPDRYIWVNLPGYYMQLRQRDSVALYSKIVCGKPKTRTPLLTSAISDLVTYPQWTIPSSIIAKDILPAIKKNPDYLTMKGYSLVDYEGVEIDPYMVDWTKYSRGIPYKVVQGSGDDNALGILKFNFPNKYAVYLHDTNQRYLFGQAMRSLSHGCVRVQQWKELAYQIIRYDNNDESAEEVSDFIPSPVEDSMNSWLEKKEKHRIPVRKNVPVFIRYFTCESKDGKIVFYDDIYGEDRLLQARYFSGKQALGAGY
ncbi:MAG: L,D-transpeptidase family protein [Chitinophagaceae bacterium]